MAKALVIFDVDGTLHDTGRWWPDLIRLGVQRFASLSGLSLQVPDDALALSVIGMRDAGVWGPFLPEEHRHRWPELRSLVVPMEVEVLRGGVDYLFPGVRELLPALSALSLRTALASNCRQAYFSAICEDQGLGSLTDWQFCLDSPSIQDKTDMLRAAQLAARGIPAIMVGDREPDHQAARAAGIPFLWRENTHCSIPDADGVWDGSLAGLLVFLQARGICWERDELLRFQSLDPAGRLSHSKFPKDG